MTGSRNPCRPHDVDAEVALLADVRLTGVEAHPHAELLPSGPVCARKRAARRLRRGPHRARKGDGSGGELCHRPTLAT